MTASGMASPPTAALAHRVSMSVRAGGRPPGARPETGPRDLGSRGPRSGGADEERSERPPGRERAPQEATPDRGPREIAVVGCGFRGVGRWGAWAPKIRLGFRPRS